MQPKQIHELLDFFYKKPKKAVDHVKRMLVSYDESTFSMWIENEKSNKIDITCDNSWYQTNTDKNQPAQAHLTIFCNTCGNVNSSPICLPCFMNSISKRPIPVQSNNNTTDKTANKDLLISQNSFEDLNFEPHLNHDVYFKFTLNGRCSCGDINSMNPNFFCPYHSLQPTNPPNNEIFGSDHCDFITDLTDICFRSLIVHAYVSPTNVKTIVDFLLELANINSSYLHLVAAALSENFDTSAMFTHWPQFCTECAIQIVKLIETLSVDDSFQYSFATSFFDNYIYLLSYELNIISPLAPLTVPTPTVPLLAAADIAWGYFISHEEMIEDFSIAELIGKEFYIITSFIRSDPFHPIVSHSLVRNFFNTMKTFFSASFKFFKNLTTAESISKISDIYIDALSIELFPIVTKKFNFYDFANFRPELKYIFKARNEGLPIDFEEKKEEEKNELFEGPDNFASYFKFDNEFDLNGNSSEKVKQFSFNRHLVLKNFIDTLDNKYSFMRCALKFKKNLFCAIEHFSDLIQSPEVFIIPLLCGMIKTFLVAMSPDQFTFQNDDFSSIACFDFDQNSNKEKEDEDEDENEEEEEKSSNNDNNSVTVNNLLNIKVNSNFERKKVSKPKNVLDGIYFTHYYESKEPFYFRSVLDDMPFISCSAPCHSITFRKFCKYSKNGTEDWQKAFKGANVFEIMFANSNYLRSTFKAKSNKGIENDLDQNVKLYLEDIALLTITIIPMRICALSSLLSLGVIRSDISYLKKHIVKTPESQKKSIYDKLFHTIFQNESLDAIDLFKRRKQEGNGLIRRKRVVNNICDDDFDDFDDIDDDIIDYEEEEDNVNYDEYDEFNEDDINGFEEVDESKGCSNYFYYNLFLKFADFSYDVIGSYAGSICALSFASNIGYLALVTYCVFDLKNGITSKKLFAYLNFLVCCVSDRAVYARDDEKLCRFFIRNLLSKRGKMMGSEILKEVDRFFSKQLKFDDVEASESYFTDDQCEAEDFFGRSNDFEDDFVEAKMRGKQVDELDNIEILSGKSHSFSEKLTARFPRPIIHRILKEMAEQIPSENGNHLVFRLREEFDDFRPSIFNTAREAFEMWTRLVEKCPTDAFLRISFDNDYKPSGFSPQSVLLTPEFFAVLFISALEAVNSKSGGFDRETIQIFFAVLNYIKQFNYFYEISGKKSKSEVKNIVAENFNDLIKLIPATFSQFQAVSIKYKSYPETTFNDLLLKFGETGQIFLKKDKNENSTNGQISSEKQKHDFSSIFDQYTAKQMSYLKPFIPKFNINRYFSLQKSDNSTCILNTIPILIFDGLSGRQMWTSTTAVGQLLTADQTSSEFRVRRLSSFSFRANAFLPVNLCPSFIPLFESIRPDTVESLISEFGVFEPARNLFNAVHCTVQSVELRLRSNPFALDDARPRALLGNSFRLLWLHARRRLVRRGGGAGGRTALAVSRAFNYRSNGLWGGLDACDGAVLSPVTSRLTVLMAMLLVVENPVETFSEALNTALKIEKNTKKEFSINFNGFEFVIQNFNESDHLTSQKDNEENNEDLLDDGARTLAFLRCAYVVATCCLWMQLDPPASLYDTDCATSLSDLRVLLLGEEEARADDHSIHFFNGLDHFAFIDLPRNFFGFSEFPFAADILTNDFAAATAPSQASRDDSTYIYRNLFDLQRHDAHKRKNHENNKNSTSSENTASITSSENTASITSSENTASITSSENTASITSSESVENSVCGVRISSAKNRDDGGAFAGGVGCAVADCSRYLRCGALGALKNGGFDSEIRGEVADLLCGDVGDFSAVIARSDANCSVLISLSGEDAGLCRAYNRSLGVSSQKVETVYLTHFGETGIRSGELLYLNKDRVMKLEDALLSGELFL